MKDIAKQYPQLTADERFRLFVEAMGRRDDQEIDRLENTCPKFHYKSQDAEYEHKKITFMAFALGSTIEGLRIDLLAAISLALSLLAHDKKPEKADELMGAFQQIMQRREGVRMGWDRFCHEIGVDPKAIAAPFLEHVSFAESMLESSYETSQELVDDRALGDAEAAAWAESEYAALVDAWADRCS